VSDKRFRKAAQFGAQLAEVPKRTVSSEPFAIAFNSDAETVEVKNPQPKQIKNFGNTKMLGLLKFFRPRKCNIVSPSNSV
jgi:hypothetical protein